MHAFLVKMTGLLHQVWRSTQPFHLSRPFLLLRTSTREVALSFTRWRRMNGEAEPSRKQAVVEPNAQQLKQQSDKIQGSCKECQ